MNNLGAGKFERSAEVFACLGIMWSPPGNRPWTSCNDIPKPPLTAPNDARVRQQWINDVMQQLRYRERKIATLQKITVKAMGDLIRTAGTVAAEKGIYDTRNELAAQGALTKQVAARTGDRRTALVNWGMLAVGVGALGLVAARARK